LISFHSLRQVSIEKTRPKDVPGFKRKGHDVWVPLRLDGTAVTALSIGDELALRAQPLDYLYTVEKVASTASSTSDFAGAAEEHAERSAKRLRLGTPSDAATDSSALGAGSSADLSGAAAPDGAAQLAPLCLSVDLKTNLTFKDICLDLRAGWFCDSTGQMLASGVTSGGANAKVAGFDFDQCLVKESGRAGQIRATPKFAGTMATLQKLHASGYKVVIFTNESVERLKKNDALERQLVLKMNRLEDFVRACGIPIPLFIGIRGSSKSPSHYRKPEAGMWRYHETHCNGGVAVCKKTSFYVGDAAGRPRDHSDGDKQFAANAGIPFFTETEYFKEK
jgi:DNA 3'-phosphatase